MITIRMRLIGAAKLRSPTGTSYTVTLIGAGYDWTHPLKLTISEEQFREANDGTYDLVFHPVEESH